MGDRLMLMMAIFICTRLRRERDGNVKLETERNIKKKGIAETDRERGERVPKTERKMKEYGEKYREKVRMP